MVDGGIIFPADEAEWIRAIFIQNKKAAMEIRVCV